MEKQLKSLESLAGSLEQISEDQHGKLVGGFTNLESQEDFLNQRAANLGYCPTKNSGCNTVAGCGK